jgi:sialic acid synthase SpsE
MKIILDFCNNHLGHNDLFQEMINKAKELSVEYAKLQLYNYHKLSDDYPDYVNIRANYKKYQVTPDMIDKFIKHLHPVKPMFTIFTLDRLRMLKNVLESIDYKGEYALKVASPDLYNTHLVNNLVDHCKAKVIPLFISTGMYSNREVDSRVKSLSIYPFIKFLYCVSKYPTKPTDISMARLLKFDGFSDHTDSIRVAKKCADEGIEFLETHFTLGKSLPGKDHLVSRTPEEIKSLQEHIQYNKNCNNYKKRWKQDEL